MGVADIDGVPIHYEVDGPADAPAVVVLHGGLGLDHVLYRRTLAPLTDDFRLVSFDQRANGRSVPADASSITIERLADDAVALADHLGLDGFTVFGHSYGGFVAQELALRHPDRIERLVLCDTTPGQLGTGEVEDEHGVGPPPPPEVLEIFGRGLPPTDEDMAEGMAAMLPAYFHRPERLDLEGLAGGTIHRAAAMARGFEVLAAWSSVDRLAGVRAPTLVLAGRHDVFTAWPQALRMSTRIPGSEVVLFEESGHFPWIEEPERFFDVVRSFLAKGLSGRRARP